MSVQEGTFIQPGSDAGSDVTQDDTQLASSAPASGRLLLLTVLLVKCYIQIKIDIAGRKSVNPGI